MIGTVECVAILFMLSFTALASYLIGFWKGEYQGYQIGLIAANMMLEESND
jgi:hypothetical protein